jgi:hypothetical protein
LIVAERAKRRCVITFWDFAKVGAPSDYRWHSSDDTSTRSLKLGYGVINVEKALSFADVHLHDQIRDRTAVPAEAAPALWRSNDVKVSGTLGKLTVEVTVHNDGPAKATNVRVKVWVIAQDNLPWELTSNLALSDGSACGSGEHLVEEIEDQGEKKIEIEVVPEEALDPTFRPYLLIAVDADNDHAFKGTLPAEEATLRYYNNLAGFGEGSDYLPKRFTHEPSTMPGSEGHVCELDLMLEEYYNDRGWENGVVPEGKLRELEII